jgi:hypothetical protein
MLAAVHEVPLKTVPNQGAAAEPKPKKTARSQAKPSQANEEDPITAGAQGRLLKDAASGCRRREK